MHSVARVIHTEPCCERPDHLRSSEEIRRGPAELPLGDNGSMQEEEVEQILGHRRRGRGFQCLVKWKNLPQRETSWEPRRNLQGAGGAITEELLKCLNERGLQ